MRVQIKNVILLALIYIETRFFMRKLPYTLLLLLIGSNIHANDVTTLPDAFKEGKVSGQIRLGYIWNDPAADALGNNYATAIGGQLKYETASWNGFSAGLALYTSHAIIWLSGDRSEGKFNDELSDDPYYDILAESYINYRYEAFNIRVGRQLIDTPYADSDDIRMTPNTFEGVVANYEVNENITLLGAYLTKWQGPDATYAFEDLLENGDGVAMAALTYAQDEMEAGIWFYNADNTANILYMDASDTFKLNDNTALTASVQFANQSELDNSGIEGMLYGAMAELHYADLSIGLAYDKVNVDNDSAYFGGFGGGVGYVNMFEMTAGVLASFEDIDAWKLSLGYDFSSLGLNGLSTTFDYGDFKGENDREAKEYNFTLAYAPSDSWNVEAVYDKIDDVYHNLLEDDQTHARLDYSLDRLLVRANFNF